MLIINWIPSFVRYVFILIRYVSVIIINYVNVYINTTMQPQSAAAFSVSVCNCEAEAAGLILTTSLISSFVRINSENLELRRTDQTLKIHFHV